MSFNSFSIFVKPICEVGVTEKNFFLILQTKDPWSQTESIADLVLESSLLIFYLKLLVPT